MVYLILAPFIGYLLFLWLASSLLEASLSHILEATEGTATGAVISLMIIIAAGFVIRVAFDGIFW